LGVVGKNPETYNDLKQAVFTDSAVTGEVAGYAMGLIMLGTADVTSTDEMLIYAWETHHEKIIRGLAVGVGFIYYGHQEEADATIKLPLAEKVCPSLLFILSPLIWPCRTLSSGMVGCIRLPWLMPEPQITMQSDDSCTHLMVSNKQQ